MAIKLYAIVNLNNEYLANDGKFYALRTAMKDNQLKAYSKLRLAQNRCRYIKETTGIPVGVEVIYVTVSERTYLR